jgi:D-amino-acid oxidase
MPKVGRSVAARSRSGRYGRQMSSAQLDALVLGAGVSGLTTAVCLAEAGLRVRVRARDMPMSTTSCAAGAMWGPLLVEHDEVEAWSTQTLDELTRLADDEATGVRLVHGIEACKIPAEPAGPVTRIADFRYCAPAELPPGFAVGWRYTAPLIDMPVYLRYLSERLARAGVTVEAGDVAAIEDVTGEARVTVNCTGVGAARLVPDPEVRAVRGQLVVAENPDLDEYFAEYTHDETDMTYYLPMGRSVILGGCAEAVGEDLRPDPATLHAIVRRCAEVEPRLRRARITGVRVGLRPSRPRVRVEHVRTGGAADVIHNYGHGGAGVSLSWGCAFAVRRIALGLLDVEPAGQSTGRGSSARISRIPPRSRR